VVILTKSLQISDKIRNYFVSVECIAGRYYGYFSGLCVFGGKVLKIKRDRCVQ
jgi:hypothetical protein